MCKLLLGDFLLKLKGNAVDFHSSQQDSQWIAAHAAGILVILCGNVLSLIHNIIQDCLDHSDSAVRDPLLSQVTFLVLSYFFKQLQLLLVRVSTIKFLLCCGPSQPHFPLPLHNLLTLTSNAVSWKPRNDYTEFKFQCLTESNVLVFLNACNVKQQTEGLVSHSSCSSAHGSHPPLSSWKRATCHGLTHFTRQCLRITQNKNHT